MLKESNKYKQTAASLFLALYLLFLGIEILHFHNYDMHSPSGVEISAEGVKPHDPYAGPAALCIVSFIAKSFANNFFSSANVGLIDYSPKKIISPESVTSNYTAGLQFYPALRAPPESISL